MPENYYDKASRFLAKLDPGAFLSWLLRLPASDFVFRGWLDTRGVPFPGDTDRVSDTVAHVENAGANGVPWIVAVEFQTKPDPEMFGRLMGYLSGLWLERKPDTERGSRFHLGAAVVNLTGSGSASREMIWPAAGLYSQLRVVERNLELESAEELLVGIEAGHWAPALLPWLPLMSGGDTSDIIDRWKVLAGGEPDRRRKAQMAAIAMLFATKTGRKAIWQTKLEGWNVDESEYVNEWMARGEVREAQQLILRIGAKKLGPAPEGVEVVVRAIQDRARLERIADRIFDAPGWGDLVATV
ncbi:hypothetical protein J8F10_22810 [Gemmata sp. G18]|uniref:Rpn family recombination-promoting nuclease/putative transposase n=1 Tax=Gemmata palustris TaxID=2822762 RepID=A0ABS5BYX0_9BACT|nr:hypothetical protein [Gemmata palustris]MBP3958093.1 hypothetical protein [Gemmata palustris]